MIERALFEWALERLLTRAIAGSRRRDRAVRKLARARRRTAPAALTGVELGALAERYRREVTR